MLEVLNINYCFRELLEKKYIFSIENKNLEGINDFFEWILDLKQNNNQQYELIIRLAFVDHYAILKQNKLNLNINEYEQSILNIYESFNDFSDLLFYVEANLENMYKMILSSIKFKNINLKNIAYMLYNLNDEFLKKFNPFSLIEKHNLFCDKSIFLLLQIYKEKIKKDDDISYSLEESVNDVIKILEIQKIGNFSNYSDLLFNMIFYYYKWKKSIQITNPQILSQNEINILRIIENDTNETMIIKFSLNEILIKDIVECFLDYNINLDEETKNQFDEIYEKYVSKEVKIKLKDV